MRYLFLIFICVQLFCGAHDIKTVDDKSGNKIFVSLGSTPKVISYMKEAGVYSSFPFNLLLVTDGNGLVTAIQEDLQYLFDKEALFQDMNFLGITHRVVNIRYNFDFRHDWHEIDHNFEEYLPGIKERYEKQIEKFKNLKNYPGKVFFVRAAFPGDYVNPNYFLPKMSEESNVITHQHAAILKDALEHQFPNLDFFLVIINNNEDGYPAITDIDRVLEFKISKHQPLEDSVRLLRSLKSDEN